MDLTSSEITAQVNYSGSTSFTLSAGTRLQLRDNETGSIVDFLNEVVPTGKSWVVNMSIGIVEMDV